MAGKRSSFYPPGDPREAGLTRLWKTNDALQGQAAARKVSPLTDEALEIMVRNLDNATLETLYYLLQAEAEIRDMIFLERG